MELQPALADAPVFAIARRSCPATGFNFVMTEPMLDPNVGSWKDLVYMFSPVRGARGVETDEKHGSELRWRDHSLSRAARVSRHRCRDSIGPEGCRPLPWSGPGDG